MFQNPMMLGDACERYPFHQWTLSVLSKRDGFDDYSDGFCWLAWYLT